MAPNCRGDPERGRVWVACWSVIGPVKKLILRLRARDGLDYSPPMPCVAMRVLGNPPEVLVVGSGGALVRPVGGIVELQQGTF